MQYSATFLALSMAATALAQSCSTPYGSGSCVSTSSCGGFSVAGYCPGATDIQCCITTGCSTSYGSGTCASTSSCASKGVSISGVCPGPSDVQCCIQTSCSTSSGSGTCLDTGNGCSGGSFIAGACPGPSNVECCVKNSGGSGSNLPGLDATQSAHARAIIAEAEREAVGHQGCLAAIATGITESNLLMYANSDVPASLNYPHDAVGSNYDSLGIFQQRAVYYPNITADMDPAQSAAQFFAIMKTISGWQTMDVGTLCQDVQKSAYPTRYSANVPAAQSICSAAGY